MHTPFSEDDSRLLSETMDNLLTILASETALKDIILRDGEPAHVTSPKGVVPIEPDRTYSKEQIELLARYVDPLWEEQLRKRAIDRALPLALTIYRTRINVSRFDAGKRIQAVIRRFPSTPPAISSVGLPKHAAAMVNQKRGLVLVVGATGSGKSYTLAAMVDWLNNHTCGHIVTLEDPIEIMHQSVKSVVMQREIGVDVNSFAHGIEDALRQAPTVILVGEVRDKDTARACLRAAESGHLVLASMHGTSAVSAIAALINMAGADSDRGVRAATLSQCLLGVVAQALVPSTALDRFVAVHEALIVAGNDAAKRLIQDQQFHELQKALFVGGHGFEASVPLAKNLHYRVQRNEITAASAQEWAYDPREWEQCAKG